MNRKQLGGALLLSTALWGLIALPFVAHAQTAPTYDAGATFVGRKANAPELHIAGTFAQPSGGDYGNNDSDAPGGVTRAFIQAVQLRNADGTVASLGGGGGGGGGTEYAEDAAHASGDFGIEVLLRRSDCTSSSAGTSGDYATFNSDATGRLCTTLTDGASVTMGALADSACATDNGTCTLQALVKRGNQRLTTLNTTLGSPFQAGASIGNTGFTASGVTASGSALTANPVTTGCRAATAAPTAVTDGQVVNLLCGVGGALVVRPYSISELLISGTTASMTGTTSTLLLAAPAATLRNYITQIACVNSHASVGTLVTVQDGSGGTALMTLAAASVFGGQTVTLPAPLRQPTTATGLYVANVTTGAAVICSATGYTGS